MFVAGFQAKGTAGAGVGVQGAMQLRSKGTFYSGGCLLIHTKAPFSSGSPGPELPENGESVLVEAASAGVCLLLF